MIIDKYLYNRGGRASSRIDLLSSFETLIINCNTVHRQEKHATRVIYRYISFIIGIPIIILKTHKSSLQMGLVILI